MTEDETSPDPGDGALVARARSGDPEALEALVAGNQGVVFRFLLGILEDEDDAADAAQETFLKALRGLGEFRGDSRFRTWLLAIARNEARTHFRRRRAARERPLDEGAEGLREEEGPDGAVIRGGEVERIRQALGRLPEKQRLSVSLRIFDGLSFRGVGDATGSSEGAARVNYHHGIRRLREWLEEDPDRPAGSEET